MKKNYRTAAAGIAALVLTLTGCTAASTSSSTNGSSAPDPSALKAVNGQTDITVWHAFGAANGVEFQKLIEQFNATNNNRIHVTSTYQGAYPDLLAKYTAGLRSKSTPTITVVNDVSSGFMTDVKQSVPAADMAKANPSGLNIADIRAAGRNYYSISGALQAVPMGMSTPVLWVNRDLLRKASINDSTDLSTVDSMIGAAIKVHQTTGAYGFTMQDDDWTVENYAASGGQNFCTPGNGRNGTHPTTITINQGAAAAALTKITSLYRSGAAVDGGVDGSAAISAFEAGKVAFMPYGSGLLGTLKRDKTSFNYQALPYPKSATVDKKTAGTTIGGAAMWLSSSATDAQKVAGWELETYLTSPAVQEAWSQVTGYVPVNINVDRSASQKTFLAANTNFQVFIKQIDGSPSVQQTAGCLSGAMTAVRHSVVGELQAAFAGTKTVETALSDAVNEAKTDFAQYEQQLGQ